MIDEMIDTINNPGLTDQQYEAIQNTICDLAIQIYMNIDQVAPEVTGVVDILCEMFDIENDTTYETNL